jgi:hypothetical protein
MCSIFYTKYLYFHLNVLEVNKPVLIVRPDNGSIGPKHVAFYVLLMVIAVVLDGNINTLYKVFTFCNIINFYVPWTKCVGP